MDLGVILERFEAPDAVREMILGRLEMVRIGGLTVGRATYQPWWRWSEHVGLVVSGVATAAFADGRVIELRPGDLFYIPPVPHDSWVVGDKRYVSVHLLGADRYAR
jgi:quercetin dioxygenase-like cupin family protein